MRPLTFRRIILGGSCLVLAGYLFSLESKNKNFLDYENSPKQESVSSSNYLEENENLDIKNSTKIMHPTLFVNRGEILAGSLKSFFKEKKITTSSEVLRMVASGVAFGDINGDGVLDRVTFGVEGIRYFESSFCGYQDKGLIGKMAGTGKIPAWSYTVGDFYKGSTNFTALDIIAEGNFQTDFFRGGYERYNEETNETEFSDCPLDFFKSYKVYLPGEKIGTVSENLRIPEECKTYFDLNFDGFLESKIKVNSKGIGFEKYVWDLTFTNKGESYMKNKIEFEELNELEALTTFPFSVLIADYDSDKDLDIIAVNSGKIQYFENQCIQEND